MIKSFCTWNAFSIQRNRQRAEIGCKDGKSDASWTAFIASCWWSERLGSYVYTSKSPLLMASINCSVIVMISCLRAETREIHMRERRRHMKREEHNKNFRDEALNIVCSHKLNFRLSKVWGKTISNLDEQDWRHVLHGCVATGNNQTGWTTTSIIWLTIHLLLSFHKVKVSNQTRVLDWPR